MSDLETFQTRIRETLGDPEAVRYNDATVNQALRTALADYSLAAPQVLKEEFTFTAGGRDHVLSLAGLSSANGLLNILEVCYPYISGDENPTYIAGFYQYFSAGSPAVHISENPAPNAGNKMLLTYSATHTIADLDGAEATTIKPTHIYGIVMGSAGFATTIRSGLLAETYGSRASDTRQLEEWGNSRIAEFERFCDLCRKEQAEILGRNPHITWKLDRWDDQ